MSTLQQTPKPNRARDFRATSFLSRRRMRRRQRNILLLLALLLTGVAIMVALSYGFTSHNETTRGKPGQANTTDQSLPPIIASGHFHEYVLPQTDSEVMPPAIDHEGRLWFGEMGKNALAVFDPRTQTFQQRPPPRGHYSIMGVQVAADDTIWFAEQDANYIGHYFPKTRHFQIYPLPQITQPNPSNAGKPGLQASGANELAFDRHGNLWFTEFNADALGWLDTHTGQMRHYALSSPGSSLNRAPFGIAIDPDGRVWFTEANSSQFGRFDPATDQFQFFSWAGSHVPFKEVASDGQGMLWLTTFTSNLLLSFNPHTGVFIPYYAPSISGHTSTDSGYGLSALAVSSSAIWVTNPAENVLARLDMTTHRFAYYLIPTPASLPLGIILADNQSIWFTEVNKIGMLQL